jgi:hypothetical protein
MALEGRALYEAHKRHMEKRKSEPGYFDPECPACQLHQQKDEKAREHDIDYPDIVAAAKDRMTTYRRLRHQGD